VWFSCSLVARHSWTNGKSCLPSWCSSRERTRSSRVGPERGQNMSFTGFRLLHHKSLCLQHSVETCFVFRVKQDTPVGDIPGGVVAGTLVFVAVILAVLFNTGRLKASRGSSSKTSADDVTPAPPHDPML
ncbi:unnamed protein product, partial [Ectocarpus sp. 13 AM-2016]